MARTFVWVDEDGDPDRVVGYSSLTGHRLVPDDLPRRIGQGSPAEIPAVLLARLALDIRHQGGGHGGVLLVDAQAWTVIATQTVAARYVVVDALPEKAAGFYQHHGFKRIPGTPRLVLKSEGSAAAKRRLAPRPLGGG